MYIGNQPLYQSFVTDTFSGNGSTTAFTMSVAPANTPSVLVAVSGVLQDPSTYSVSGTTLTFSAAPPSGTGNISARYLGIPASGVVTTAYRTVTEFTATASQTTFTPPSYTPGFINVYQNGSLLGSADYTATNGTTVVLAVGATVGDLVVVESFYVSSVLNAIPATLGSISSTYLAAGSVGTTQIASGAVTPTQLSTQSQYTGFKNRIINGAMMIDQRNAGSSVTISSNVYTLDRWLAVQTQASKYSVQRNAGAVTPPAGFINYLGITSLAATTVGSGDLFFINQRIEGLNVTDLGWGTASAQTVTLSFWVRSSLTGTFGGSLRNSASNRSYPFTYTITAANTWEKETITISGDTSGTWLTDNGIGIDLALSIGMGSTYSSTAGAWAAGNYVSATGATSVVSTNGATFYVTGVQLEVGSVATSFDARDYGRELIMCQRYYEVFGNGGVGGTRGSVSIFAMGFKFQVTKRTSPTITQLASFSVVAPGVSGYTISSINAVASVSTTGVFTELNSTTNGSSSYPLMYGNSNINDFLSASAEL